MRFVCLFLALIFGMEAMGQDSYGSWKKRKGSPHHVWDRDFEKGRDTVMMSVWVEKDRVDLYAIRACPQGSRSGFEMTVWTVGRKVALTINCAKKEGWHVAPHHLTLLARPFPPQVEQKLLELEEKRGKERSFVRRTRRKRVLFFCLYFNIQK